MRGSVKFMAGWVHFSVDLALFDTPMTAGQEDKRTRGQEDKRTRGREDKRTRGQEGIGCPLAVVRLIALAVNHVLA